MLVYLSSCASQHFSCVCAAHARGSSQWLSPGLTTCTWHDESSSARLW